MVWCPPWRVAIPAGLLKDKGNELQIEAANLWPNRLIGDQTLSKEQRRTETNIHSYETPVPPDEVMIRTWGCPICEERRRTGKPPDLLPSGLLGPVRIMQSVVTIN